MKLEYELKIEQTQKLSMTPELIQAIQILQYNNAELNEYIDRELLENPVLEAEKTTDNNLEIIEKISQADYFDKSFRQWEYSPVDEEDDYSFEKFITQDKTLSDYLNEQLTFTNLKGRDREIGLCMLEAIDSNGYLMLSLDEISKLTGSSVEECEDVLDIIQGMEPVGVGARNLEECLLLQMCNMEIVDDKIAYVIKNLLEDVAENRISKISKEISEKPARVQEIIDFIRSLEPKPGRKFSNGETVRYIVPDVIVEKIDGQYQVLNNDSGLPRLKISSYYDRLSKECKSDEEVGKYLSDRLNSAIWLIKSIDQRKQTIFNVASEIVRLQQDFFELGEKHLKSMTLKQVADELNVHESTVSRSINGKYMQSPRGIFEMKYFFSSGLNNQEGEDISSKSIKSMIKDIISGEDKLKPYSDSDIVGILSNKGIDISRRTVAKYREGMGILSSSKRRRF